MRLCIDIRRPAECGVGRVSFNVGEALAELRKTMPFRLVVLCAPRTHSAVQYLDPDEVIVSEARFFTHQDVVGLPAELRGKIDAFWSTQFYVSPFFECPMVTMIHDLWPVRYPQWLPNQDEVMARHGTDVAELAAAMIRRFELEVFPTATGGQREAYRSRVGELDQFMYAMMMLAASTSDIITTCSHSSLEDIAAFMPNHRHKLRLVSPFVRGMAKPRIDAGLRPRRVLMVAKFDPRKNHRFALEVIQELFKLRAGKPPVEAHFVGDIGYRSFGQQLVREALAVEVNGCRVVFHDAVAESDLWELYASSDVLLMPSLDEGFGLPILEAMEARLPVATSRRGALPEVGGDFVRFVDLEDARVSAMALDDLISRPQEAAALAERAFAHSNRQYSFASAVHQVRQVVLGLISGDPSGNPLAQNVRECSEASRSGLDKP